jgi:hypothetical protein
MKNCRIAALTTLLLACIGLPEAHVKGSADPVPSTPMEAALDSLRARFPNQIVIGFEELWNARPDIEPQVDLGTPNASLEEVLRSIRRLNPQYKIELLHERLVHVYPANGTADPAGLLDLRLQEFFLPPDDCMAQQMLNMENSIQSFSYTPELGAYLWEHKAAWHRTHGKEMQGVVGDFMGDCEPAHHRREPIYRNITVRESLNLMAVRSLQVARGDVPSTAPKYFKPKPMSWKYRFRRDPEADTGLAGVPIFQTF